VAKEIALALGGGGVRGFAHLGVLHVLQKSDFIFSAIAGTSAGSIIGSLVAAGLSCNEIQALLEAVESHHVFQRKPGDLPSLMGISGLEEVLRKQLGKKKFSDLQIPFMASAVNLHTGACEILTEGDVVDAVMASCAVPGFFPPRKIAEKTYIDGGVVMPVPVKPLRQLRPDLPVVAVALSPSMEEWGDYAECVSLLSALPVLQRFIDRSRLAQSISTFLTAVDLGNAQITDLSLEIDPPDIVIRPRVYEIGLLEQSRADPLITAGEDAVFECLNQIRWLVSWQGKLVRKIPALKNMMRVPKT
jgi:NTE family protein